MFYPATDAPRFRNGAIAMICVSIATLGVTWLVWYLERRENRIRARTAERSDDKSVCSRIDLDDSRSPNKSADVKLA